MKKRMIVILGAIIVLFIALVLVVNHKNSEKIEKSNNPYGKETLRQETIDQLDDPLYQNQIIPSNLDKKLEKKEDMLVYFYSSTCEHCKRVSPVLVPLAEKMNVDMKKVNLWEFYQEAYWDKYFIKGTPTLVQYKDGVEEDRLVGEHTKKEYENFINEYKKYANKK